MGQLKQGSEWHHCWLKDPERGHVPRNASASRSWKRQERGFSPRASRGLILVQRDWPLDFCPSELWPKTLMLLLSHSMHSNSNGKLIDLYHPRWHSSREPWGMPVRSGYASAQNQLGVFPLFLGKKSLTHAPRASTIWSDSCHFFWLNFFSSKNSF